MLQTRPQNQDAVQTARPFDPALDSARTILVIDAPSALALLRPRPGRQTVVVTQKRNLSAAMLATVAPDVIIGPLIAAEWDIVDLGILLESLGFSGQLMALTRPLPRAELVIREVGALCKRLTVRLLETG